MIELKNLTKIYTTKAGEVRALNDVSVTLPDKGIVFILGKSGSGKSTMLNVVGGLDRATSGDIIIDGKSSSTFKDGDFDAYRNTYIGFVFQEYNLLNDFTIASNIALATDLQSKHDNGRIDEILKLVDLDGMGDRKPTTLSGGQKQRVALARALVKDPAVIMADEPTGALDSETGEQIFQTLKKLSMQKLVIVVSHDRDFAQRFGDRIIELEDGKIVYDSDNGERRATKLSGDVAVLGSSVLIKQGATLSEENANALRRALTEAPESKIVFRTEEEMRLATEAAPAKASDKAAEQNSEARPPLKLIRSRLPVHKAVRIGASSMRKKPFRLIFTILLSAIAFGLFGISDTLIAYNRVDTTVRTIRQAGVDYATFEKEVYTTLKYDAEENPEPDTPPSHPSFTIDEVNRVSNATGARFYPFYLTYYGLSNHNENAYTKYYNWVISGYVEINQERFDELGYKLVGETSHLPESDDEVLITLHHFEHYKHFGFETKNGPDEPVNHRIETYEDLIGRELSLGYGIVKIAGIVDTGFGDRYPTLDKTLTHFTNLPNKELFVWNAYNDEIKNSFHAAIFVRTGYAQRHFVDWEGNITYRRIIAKMPSSKKAIKQIVTFEQQPFVDVTYNDKTFLTTTQKTYYTLIYNSAGAAEQYDQMIQNLSTTFLIAGVVCAVFAALLLFNFISVSIQHKKREIGILRALGARKADVFFIFLAECLLISLFAWAFACVIAAIGPTVINSIIKDKLGIQISLLAFSARQLLVMLGVAFVVGIAGCFLPTYRAARKKPVDAIRS